MLVVSKRFDVYCFIFQEDRKFIVTMNVWCRTDLLIYPIAKEIYMYIIWVSCTVTWGPADYCWLQSHRKNNDQFWLFRFNLKTLYQYIHSKYAHLHEKQKCFCWIQIRWIHFTLIYTIHVFATEIVTFLNELYICNFPWIYAFERFSTKWKIVWR